MAGPVHDMAYDGTVYVRVSLSGLIQTSTNGVDWTNRTSGVSNDLWGAAWGNGFFVVSGDGGTMLTSPDGINWTPRASTTSEDIYSVMFSDIFMACGTNGLILASTILGDAWGGIDSGTALDLWDISSDNGTYEAVGDDDIIVVGEITTDNLTVSLFDDVDVIQEEQATGVFNASSADDFIMRNRPFHDEEQLQWWDIATENLLVQQDLIDHGAFNSQVADVINIFQRLFDPDAFATDGFSVADLVFGNWLVNLLANLTVDDTTTYRYTAADAFIETIAIDDTTASSLVMGVEIVDSAALTDDVLTTRMLMTAIQEGTIFNTVIDTSAIGPGGSTDSQLWTAWVVNTRNFAVSQYDRYDFHSFAEYESQYFGGKDTGIYLLEGADDDGWLIKALIKTGLLDFGSEFQKKMPRMYLGLRNDDTMVLKTITNEGVERWYQMLKNQSGLGKSRFKSQGGVKSAYWQFEIANVTGNDFDINTIELMPIILSRRVK